MFPRGRSADHRAGLVPVPGGDDGPLLGRVVACEIVAQCGELRIEGGRLPRSFIVVVVEKALTDHKRHAHRLTRAPLEADRLAAYPDALLEVDAPGREGRCHAERAERQPAKVHGNRTASGFQFELDGRFVEELLVPPDPVGVERRAPTTVRAARTLVFDQVDAPGLIEHGRHRAVRDGVFLMRQALGKTESDTAEIGDQCLSPSERIRRGGADPAPSLEHRSPKSRPGTAQDTGGSPLTCADTKTMAGRQLERPT